MSEAAVAAQSEEKGGGDQNPSAENEVEAIKGEQIGQIEILLQPQGK